MLSCFFLPFESEKEIRNNNSNTSSGEGDTIIFIIATRAKRMNKRERWKDRIGGIGKKLLLYAGATKKYVESKSHEAEKTFYFPFPVLRRI